MNIVQTLQDFVRQSQRVLLVTHKPKSYEYKHIATSTAIGLVVIGVIGFAISMIVQVLRHGDLLGIIITFVVIAALVAGIYFYARK